MYGFGHTASTFCRISPQLFGEELERRSFIMRLPQHISKKNIDDCVSMLTVNKVKKPVFFSSLLFADD